MNKTFFLLIAVFILFVRCNNNDKNGETDSGRKEKPMTPRVEAMQKQLQQFPDSAGLRLKLAMELDSLNMYKPAIAQMDSLVKNDSTNYGLWYTKGQVHEHAGDTSQAILDYIAAVKIYPSPDALLSLANLYAEQKNPRSILICNQVKEMGLGRSYDAACDFIAGVYNARIGEKKLAISLFDASISNDYTYMPSYIEKGLVYFDSGQYQQALEVFSFAATVNHLYPDAYYYMGRSYEMMKNNDSAAFYFKQSLALDKESPETKAALKRVQ